MNSLGIDIGGSSVKLAVVHNGSVVWTARSAAYANPDVPALTELVRQTLRNCPVIYSSAGVCTPGLLNVKTGIIEQSINIPHLVGTRLDAWAADCVGVPVTAVSVTTDVAATGYDIQISRNLRGRLLLVAIGTGIGAAVLDDGVLLRVSGESSGHFGQMDVSLNDKPPIGADGGAGSLEAYWAGATTDIGENDAPMIALARAIRIAQAIYRPHHICLAGGIGIRLGRLLPSLRILVEKNLTGIARSEWTLSVGESDFHAAMGAARLGSPNPHGEDFPQRTP